MQPTSLQEGRSRNSGSRTGGRMLYFEDNTILHKHSFLLNHSDFANSLVTVGDLDADVLQ